MRESVRPPRAVPLASPADVAATFCATLVDEWARAGLTEAVVAPGSRSTPLALALAAEPRMRVDVVLDERSAGFVALGRGLATGRPAVVLTTSGTAAVELHPAVVEAHHGRVPLIACTADRPPELRDVAAPQTIDQTRLFGPVVRWFAEPGVADAGAVGGWRSLAARAVAEATGPAPGPVHLNLAFREPLVGSPGPLPPGRADGGPWHRRRAGAPAPADIALPHGERGVIVAGAASGQGSGVARLAEGRGWPVLADPRAGYRVGGHGPAVAAFDALLRHRPFADAHRPEVVVRVGDPPASKVLSQWLAGSGARQVVVHPAGAWVDPDHTAESVIGADPDDWLARAGADPAPSVDPGWLATWCSAEAAAQQAIDAALATHAEATEPGVARTLSSALPDGAVLVVSSSMPVRDLEWYGRPRPGVTVLANRGANGIDGVVSTAVGVALGSAGPTAALLGDLAFLHDSAGLVGLTRRGVDLTLVVVDNDGGGIFSFLPQRTQLSDERFEALLGTPQGADLAALAGAHGVAVTQPATADDVAGAVADAVAAGGVRMVHVRTDRSANVAVHDQLHAAVGRALDEA